MAPQATGPQRARRSVRRFEAPRVPLPPMDDWRSYDDVARTYERVHAPRFAEPAGDLLAMAGVHAGLRLLDIGTGTGVAAEVARSLGADAVGVDASLEMLRVGRAAHPELT